ncbi:MAG: glutamate--tRNA ligase [Alphaproteobacteria bacterium]|nr:glutamate--tRNA ligase [Alphaproteobacteria bacterium]
MTINVRFAPSPTGMLHIGGARTALINYLFTLSNGGNYHLRIEDTDKQRSTDEAKQAIISGLDWLGLLPKNNVPKNNIILQSDNIGKHQEAAHALISKGAAYYCYETPEQLATKRLNAEKNGEKYFYDRFWRDKSDAEAKKLAPNITPSVRLKMPLDGASMIDDMVQGKVEVGNEQLDDFIILRSDQSPTYLLSCVIDDVMMQISHIIRGDDHLTNAFRQLQLFNALDVTAPLFAHIPLLYGEDGKKFSKRHGAVAISEYQKMGYLPDAINNYLLRLGWGKTLENAENDAKKDEIISPNEAATIFQLQDLSKAPARFDFAKLNHLNGLYLRDMPNQDLRSLTAEFLTTEQRENQQGMEAFEKGLAGLATRADKLTDFTDIGAFYFTAPDITNLTDKKAEKAINSETAPEMLTQLHQLFSAMGKSDDAWNREAIHKNISELVATLDVGFGKIAQPLRAVLSGTMASPDLSEIAACLGRDEVLKRIKNAIEKF